MKSKEHNKTSHIIPSNNSIAKNTQNQIQTSHQAQNSNENTWLLGNVNKSNSINNHMNELISIRSNQPLLDNYNQQQREQANKFI